PAKPRTSTASSAVAEELAAATKETLEPLPLLTRTTRSFTSPDGEARITRYSPAGTADKRKLRSPPTLICRVKPVWVLPTWTVPPLAAWPETERAGVDCAWTVPAKHRPRAILRAVRLIPLEQVKRLDSVIAAAC